MMAIPVQAVGRSVIGLVVAGIVTALGLAFAYFAGINGKTAFGYPIFFVCAAVAFGVNWLAFIPAAIAQQEKYYDLVGSLTYLSIIAAACYLASPLDLRAMIVAAMVATWATRLGGFLFMRVGKTGGDSRFDKIKTNPTRFFTAWTLQALWATVSASAAIVIISSSERVEPEFFFWLGAAVWLAGFAIEVIADWQKSAFKDDPANKGKYITTGIWGWSQHPNYFGEITLWFGLLIMAWPLLSGTGFLVIASPVLIYLLLTKVSGVNLQDKQGDARWGDDAGYQAYRRNTSVLVPLPPKKG
ncbi:DUF1295 domain-containing protein [Qipengyuania sp. DGS5-3]|uniref:DUF1295 domain-containing protein n=1 Tax=Qipengyuania sp. DGS5-3 TaxID=3349632 RepID=UPI0036D3A4A8